MVRSTAALALRSAITMVLFAGALAGANVSDATHTIDATSVDASARQVTSACDCTRQDTLDCSSLGLQSLNVDVHACPWPVRLLLLRHNRLTELPQLPESIEEVDIAWNSLAHLPRENQLSRNTKVLDVSWNGASSAGDELQALSSLVELQVTGNRLGTLRFLPSPCALRVLRAADNVIWHLDDALARCTRLRELDLSGNVLGATPARALAPLSRLEELRLARCRLALLPPAAFAGLRKLRVLDLSWNELQVMPMDAISHMTTLRNINLAGNRLKVLPPTASFSRFPLLEKIYLTNNAITTLSPNTFANLSLLETLELDFNRLHSLPGGIFLGLVNLERLLLSGNPLPAEALSELAPLRRLTSLYLDRCSIRNLPSRAFAAQLRLQVLTMCCNLMSSVAEDSLAGHLQLRDLKLNNNSLDVIPDNIFTNLPGLRTLDVSANRLQALPSAVFTHLRSLRILDASGNRLRRLPALDECCPPPKVTLLRDNELLTPDAAALYAWLYPSGPGGDEETLVDLRGPHARFESHALAIALAPLRVLNASNPRVQVFAEQSDCSCGGVRARHGARLLFCVDAACAGDVPGVAKDWIEVVNRSANYVRVAKVVAVVVASGDAAVRSYNTSTSENQL